MVAGFAHAPVTKGILITLPIISVLVSLSQLKPFVHLQLDPHIYVHHQWYRLVSQHFAFINSSELFLALLLFYHAGVKVERTFGTYKYASFLLVVTSIYTATQLVLLGLSSTLLSNSSTLPSIGTEKKQTEASRHWLTEGRSPAGPWGPLFALLHQYHCIIPHLWSIRIGPIILTDKHISISSLSVLLAFSQTTSTLFASILGLLVSALYRSSPRLQAYRIPHRLYRILSLLLAPWIGHTRLPRRSWRVEPPQRRTLQARQARLAEHNAALVNASRFSGVGVPTLTSLLRRRTGAGTVLPVQGQGQAGEPPPAPAVGGWNDVPPVARPPPSGPGRPM
ncbi:Peptidase S54, rhomboid domain protein [Kalmanozyma brasiliensis GHG001]|uniref:Peptidase S54, rhomboid domain protein n=1 Tax=Kalmanozyma brasiliensis (strain GHG001) TaxID=1365824 RepID=UPI002867D96D|nr:Peptidase S54, rhomboid domain protein [Kalmanozyma brasiliensis GHG001]KAF6766964.1 Peptidase S54, rhomboid domain protein [Kalmanozyma brasiliensis GHG001]